MADSANQQSLFEGHLLQAEKSKPVIHYTNYDYQTVTKREREVLGYLAKGLSTKVIAQNLQLSGHTIESYRKRLLEKFDAKNTAELIKKAAKIFWLE